MPTVLQTSATASDGGVRVTVTAASVPFVAGTSNDVTVRIENRGSTTIHWTGGASCGSPGRAYVHLVSDAWIGGQPHSGIAAEFKAYALEVSGASGFSPLSVALRAHEGFGCVETAMSGHGRLTAGGIAVPRELKSGAKLEGILRWTGTAAAPIPAGPADLVYEFEFYPTVDNEPGDRTTVEARLPSWVLSDDVVDFIPPGPAIDIALADTRFATWLAEAPSSTWINSAHDLDLEKGTWTIGLFRSSPASFYGGVTFDARTGEDVVHRFE